MLLTVGRSYVGNDVTHSTLLDRACGVARILVWWGPGGRVTNGRTVLRRK